MNKEELIELLNLNDELSPKYIMKIKDSNNSIYELYKIDDRVKIYELDWDQNRKNWRSETIFKNIIFPVRTI